MLTPVITSYIRTYVPVYLAVFVGWLATHGVDVPAATVLKGNEAITLYAFTAYYGVIRFLEERWPKLGWLLGKVGAPSYSADWWRR